MSRAETRGRRVRKRFDPALSAPPRLRASDIGLRPKALGHLPSGHFQEEMFFRPWGDSGYLLPPSPRDESLGYGLGSPTRNFGGIPK